jgi:molybdenum cofactor cytidylyltransferase
VGLRACAAEAQAALVALGDQPQILPEVVRAVLRAYEAPADGTARPGLVAPSYQMRRGHPWLVDRSLWPSIFALGPEQTMRDVLNAHAGRIHYVTVDTPTVLKDLDTPQDYQQERP